jgi:hypothetical protein
VSDGDDIRLVPFEAQSVAPTTTTLMAALDLRSYRADRLTINIVNDDLAQTLTLDLQFGPTATGPWTSSGAMVATLAAGEGVSASVDTAGYAFARIIGTASGAGLSARVGVSHFRRWR